MVEPDFGEVQFMNDLMTELHITHPESIVGAPYYPTQNKEKFYGSDVILAVGNPDSERNLPFITVFMQFKRSDKLTISLAKYWDDFGGQYYRFNIHDDIQHNTLVTLDDHLGSAGYVVPGFHKNDERHRYINDDGLLDNSLFLQPDQTASNDDHEICYTISPMDATMYSEPVDIEDISQVSSTLESVLQRGSLYETFEGQRDAFRQYRYELVDEISDIPEREYPDEEQYENPIEWLYTVGLRY